MLFRLIQTEPLAGVVFLLAIIFAISIHEFSHALAAYLLGDNTAKYDGRLTVNPLAHLDPIGSLLLLFVGFGWGKPVPYNPYNLSFPKWGPVIVGLAGPFSNIILFVLSGVVYNVVTTVFRLPEVNLLVVFLFLLGILNVGLALFNLIPIHPLDGAKLLDALLPDRFSELKANIFHYGPTILFSLIFFDIVFNVSVFGFLGDLTEKIFFSFFRYKI
jgi:Zn-dependent protease